MRRFGLTGLSLICAAAFLMAVRAADEPVKDKAKSGNMLVGTWKLVTGKYGGQEAGFPEGTTMLKHITPTQFMWASYDREGKVFRAAGGSYTLKGETYEETPEYGFSSDFDAIKGKTHAFKAKVVGNRWHSDGMLASGVTIEEVWERQDRK
jgi:hypothetical protein